MCGSTENDANPDSELMQKIDFSPRTLIKYAIAETIHPTYITPIITIIFGAKVPYRQTGKYLIQVGDCFSIDKICFLPTHFTHGG